MSKKVKSIIFLCFLIVYYMIIKTYVAKCNYKMYLNMNYRHID